MTMTFIIAEAGVNHNGSIEIAKKMVDAAVEAGADAIKFQTFNAEKLVSRFAQKAEYQKRSTGSGETQFEMLKKLELSVEEHKELIKHCKKKGIIFLSSPFDLNSIDFLNELGLKIFKIPSGEIINLPYLKKIGGLKKKVILSTGMADLGEIEDAMDILMDSGTSKEDITVLHCTTEYPTLMEEANLRAMLAIRDAFKINVGYSDHTLGIEISIAAVALGAAVIEKHFTLDRNMPGPDHKASLEPQELNAMVKTIRNVEKAKGSGIKKPSPSEIKNISAARKSIVASKDIKKGEIFRDENITTKRPGTGISPMEWDRIIGRKAIREFKEDELIEI
ncbi:MAG: N-acetylneuraminate synthase [Nitrospirae bacterium]|nr:N-acetylneuraminate synthase [Nitrospirota bacterium]